MILLYSSWGFFLIWFLINWLSEFVRIYFIGREKINIIIEEMIDGKLKREVLVEENYVIMFDIGVKLNILGEGIRFEIFFLILCSLIRMCVI